MHEPFAGVAQPAAQPAPEWMRLVHCGMITLRCRSTAERAARLGPTVEHAFGAAGAKFVTADGLHADGAFLHVDANHRIWFTPALFTDRECIGCYLTFSNAFRQQLPLAKLVHPRVDGRPFRLHCEQGRPARQRAPTNLRPSIDVARFPLLSHRTLGHRKFSVGHALPYVSRSPPRSLHAPLTIIRLVCWAGRHRRTWTWTWSCMDTHSVLSGSRRAPAKQRGDAPTTGRSASRIGARHVGQRVSVRHLWMQPLWKALPQHAVHCTGKIGTPSPSASSARQIGHESCSASACRGAGGRGGRGGSCFGGGGKCTPASKRAATESHRRAGEAATSVRWNSGASAMALASRASRLKRA